MRKILFRGKEINTGEWVYGSLLYSGSENQYYIVENYDEELSYPVRNETIGQYTGLKDKNGTKIFEGDIVKWITSLNDNIVGKIIFKDCAFALSFKDYLGDICGMKDIEVIGNIFDNPIKE